MNLTLVRWLACAVFAIGHAASACNLPGVTPPAMAELDDAAAAASKSSPQASLAITVDATNVGQRIFMVHERLTARPGRLRLLYPRWLPGHHGPVGDPSQIAGLTVRVGARRLAWQRPPDDPYAFDVDVPAGASEVDVHFQWLGSAKGTSTQPAFVRDSLALQWPMLTLYPAGIPPARVVARARVKLPGGWGWGSALRGNRADEGWVQFEPETLDTLLDSPVFAGVAHRRYDMDPPGTASPVALHMFGEADAGVLTEAQVDTHRRVFQQADRLFGWRPWRHYDLLIVNSKGLALQGLEHQESSENIFDGHYLDDWNAAARWRELVAHELVHAWNGKARRPADLWAADLNTPTHNALLWVYEGLTHYYGWVIAARSGLITPQQLQRRLAITAAQVTSRAGREWRSLQDTTFDPLLASTQERPWADWSLGWDYYTESALLIWLDADTLIRERTGGACSLDDAARLLMAGESGRKGTTTYRFDDVVAAMNRVLPLDWRAFFRTRLDRTAVPAAVDGLGRAGWQLAFAESRSPLDLAELDPDRPTLSARYSVGLTLGKDGDVVAVAWASPAFSAGIAPGDRLVAVQLQAYTPQRLEAALHAAKGDSLPGRPALSLLMQRGDDFRSVELDVRTGPRHPRLERIGATPDMLAEIIRPR